MRTEKILDATCGSRMMWFDKNHPDTLFVDKRDEKHILCDGRTLEIRPDIEVDFTNMPFEDESFYLVVFDPPHIKNLSLKSWTAAKYGTLLPTWETEIKAGFDECMRVLKKNGTLIFKWNERDISTKRIIELINVSPLFGHRTSKKGFTIWMTFMKS